MFEKDSDMLLFKLDGIFLQFCAIVFSNCASSSEGLNHIFVLCDGIWYLIMWPKVASIGHPEVPSGQHETPSGHP